LTEWVVTVGGKESVGGTPTGAVGTTALPKKSLKIGVICVFAESRSRGGFETLILSQRKYHYQI
jgi:hypothetical protein